MDPVLKLTLYLVSAVAVYYGGYLFLAWMLTRPQKAPARITRYCANCRPTCGYRGGHVYRSRNVRRARKNSDLSVYWLANNSGEKCSAPT